MQSQTTGDPVITFGIIVFEWGLLGIGVEDAVTFQYLPNGERLYRPEPHRYVTELPKGTVRALASRWGWAKAKTGK